MNFELIKKMLFIRRLEEAIGDCYAEQKMRCPTHLSIGQELPAIALCDAMSASDLSIWLKVVILMHLSRSFMERVLVVLVE